jgi:hypothetical protein
LRRHIINHRKVSDITSRIEQLTGSAVERNLQ